MCPGLYIGIMGVTMRRMLGGLVFVAGVAGLGYWGSESHAPKMEAAIGEVAKAAVGDMVHPLDVTVQGRDITVSGLADTEAELIGIETALNGVVGRRVVNLDGVKVLPKVEPYGTTLIKDQSGTAVSGYGPSAAAKAMLKDAGLSGLEALPLGHGAPAGWAGAIKAGAGALSPLDKGSFALTGQTATLQGVAATPAEKDAAMAALAPMAEGFEQVVSIDVTDPGVVDFTLGYDAGAGLSGKGTVPRSLGADGIAGALGLKGISGDMGTTFADMDGLKGRLGKLAGVLPSLDGFEMVGKDGKLSLTAQALPGLDLGVVKGRLTDAMGGDVNVTVATRDVAAGTERMNIATGTKEKFHAGFWLPVMDFEATKPACSENVARQMGGEKIQFVTGSADLDPASLAVVARVAGLVLHCTQGPGMRVRVGGHTDAQGDDNANYSLSVKRAKAVRDVLIARGVAADRIQAVGYGETEPVADNDTEEGRAKNRRTTFEWPQ